VQPVMVGALTLVRAKMNRAPVYFIGDTFGGTGSGWMIAVIVAVLTAFGAFLIGLLVEDYKRHRDKQALAAALRSEIRVLLQLVAGLEIEKTTDGCGTPCRAAVICQGTKLMPLPSRSPSMKSARIGWASSASKRLMVWSFSTTSLTGFGPHCTLVSVTLRQESNALAA
jgi:hypothetical protein